MSEPLEGQLSTEQDPSKITNHGENLRQTAHRVEAAVQELEDARERQHAAIRAAAADGVTKSRIAVEVGLHAETVRQIVRTGA